MSLPHEELPEDVRQTMHRASAAAVVNERDVWQANGFLGLAVSVIFGLIALGSVGVGGAAIILAVPFAIAALLVLSSLSVIQPNETRVVQFFGRYIGTARKTGLVWLPPLITRQVVSVRVGNFETARLKVNDSNGNPVEVAAIVVWRVSDTARALFSVSSYEDFVSVQADAAVRHIARSYPYDAPSEVESLRGSTDVISGGLANEVAARVDVAGVEIIEVRISHLAYAPEIAQAMLQRQQASAVVDARSRIVEGAVGMVQMALAELTNQHIVELSEDRRAALVSNLLVVLCGDSRTTPVVNAGASS